MIDSGEEQEFYNGIRTHVVLLIYFLFLFTCCYYKTLGIGKFDLTFLVCSLALTSFISLMLLSPTTIIYAFIQKYYPDNFYLQWFNEMYLSVLWNYSYIFMNLLMFILLPFTYFYGEIEIGSITNRSKRLKETLFGLSLLAVLLSMFIGFARSILNLPIKFSINQILLTLSTLISVVSGLISLISFPFGVVRVFKFIASIAVAPYFVQMKKEELQLAEFEIAALKQKLKGSSSSYLQELEQSRDRILTEMGKVNPILRNVLFLFLLSISLMLLLVFFSVVSFRIAVMIVPFSISVPQSLFVDLIVPLLLCSYFIFNCVYGSLLWLDPEEDLIWVSLWLLLISGSMPILVILLDLSPLYPKDLYSFMIVHSLNFWFSFGYRVLISASIIFLVLNYLQYFLRSLFSRLFPPES